MYERCKEIMIQQAENLKALSESKYAENVSSAIDMILDSLRSGHKIMLAGNGGSAADAQHFAGEFVGRFLKEREGLPAIALTTDPSVVTCISNDYGYDNVFSREINAIGDEGDVFIGISTSGNSQNIINAVEESRKKKIKTVALLGKDGGILKGLADVALLVPFKETPKIQEIHTMTVHMICELVEEMMFQ